MGDACGFGKRAVEVQRGIVCVPVVGTERCGVVVVQAGQRWSDSCTQSVRAGRDGRLGWTLEVRRDKAPLA